MLMFNGKFQKASFSFHIRTLRFSPSFPESEWNLHSLLTVVHVKPPCSSLSCSEHCIERSVHTYVGDGYTGQGQGCCCCYPCNIYSAPCRTKRICGFCSLHGLFPVCSQPLCAGLGRAGSRVCAAIGTYISLVSFCCCTWLVAIPFSLLLLLNSTD